MYIFSFNFLDLFSSGPKGKLVLDSRIDFEPMIWTLMTTLLGHINVFKKGIGEF